MTLLRDLIMTRGSRTSDLDPVLDSDIPSSEAWIIEDTDSAPIKVATAEQAILAGVGLMVMSLFLGVLISSTGDATGGVCAPFALLFCLGTICVIAGGTMKARGNSYVDSLVEPPDIYESDLMYNSEWESVDFELRKKQQMEEIVKMVKSTIKIRCRYCGTLNEEAATNCNACGAPL